MTDVGLDTFAEVASTFGGPGPPPPPPRTLTDLRGYVAAVLAGVSEDIAVHDGPVDSVTPPAYMLVWSDPWLTPVTVCAFTARLDVVCIAARIDPAPGYEQLEQMVAGAAVAFDTAGIPVVTVARPVPHDQGGVTYQAARLTVTYPITLEGAT
jgi:hypothetical protein